MVVLSSKYVLPEDDGFLEREDLSSELPKYEDQGQTRGRKPKRVAEAGKGGKAKQHKGHKKTEGKKGGGKKGQKQSGKKSLQGRRNRKAKVERVKRAASKSTLGPSAASEPPLDKKRKPRKTASSTKDIEPPKPIESIVAEEVVFSVPDDAVEAPPTTNGNSIYSSAYRKAQKLGGACEGWRQQGQHASWLFRTHKMISPSLSGMPRQPKSVPVSKGLNVEGGDVENTSA